MPRGGKLLTQPGEREETESIDERRDGVPHVPGYRLPEPLACDFVRERGHSTVRMVVDDDFTSAEELLADDDATQCVEPE